MLDAPTERKDRVVEWDDVAEVFAGTLLAGIVLLYVVMPLASRRGRRRWMR